jgi:hypothetical protein
MTAITVVAIGLTVFAGGVDLIEDQRGRLRLSQVPG